VGGRLIDVAGNPQPAKEQSNGGVIPLPPSNFNMPRIEVSGQALKMGSPRHPNTFFMNVGEDVDVTRISCMLQGQGQPEMWTNNKGGGLIEVSYRIGLVGNYKIHITYDGQHIEGSPFPLVMR